MPQPLKTFGDKVKRIYLSNSGDSPSRNRPELALLAMNVIAEHSILDAFFRSVFITLLGENPRPAAAVYSSLNSENARRDAFRAVAKTSLSNPEMDVLECLFTLQNPVSKTRNKLAHWTWGHSPELPDAFLLVDPEDHAQNTITNAEAYAEYRRKNLARLLLSEPNKLLPAPNLPQPTREDIYVFEKEELVGASKDIQRLIELVIQFRWILNRSDPESKDGTLLARLSDEPEVREHLKRLAERRKKTP
jgi:hypothetical protein